MRSTRRLTRSAFVADEPWDDAGPLRVRMGVHTGEARASATATTAARAVNRAARLMAVAHGGQIVVSRATERAGPRRAGRESSSSIWVSTGCATWRRPERVFQVVASRPGARVPAVAVARRVPGQPAASGDDVRRARGGDRVAGGAGASVVAGDADRGGRGRQDPPRAPGRGGSRRRVPGWCVVVRVRAGHRSGGGVGDVGGVPAGAAAAGSGARRVGARLSRREAAVVGARQLRASPRCGRAPGGRDRASLPAGVGAGDEPGGPRAGGRADRRGAVAGRPGR